MKNNTLAAVITACLTILTIAGIAMAYDNCNRQSERRMKCIESGKSAMDCKALFHTGDGS